MSIYEWITTHAIFGSLTYIGLWIASLAIGFNIVQIKNNGWQFRVSSILSLTACVAVLLMILKIWLYVPDK